MAQVPSYADFSKDLNDLLIKDFPVAAAKLEVNATAPNGIVCILSLQYTILFINSLLGCWKSDRLASIQKLTVNNVRNSAAGAISSDVKAKYTDRENGLTITNTWHLANVLSSHIELQDFIASGLKIDVLGSMKPSVGTTTAKAGLELKQANVFARSSVDLLAKSGATVHTDVVVGSDGLLIGGDVAYNTEDATIHRYNVAVGFKTPEYSLGFHATKKFTNFSANYFHTVSSGLQVGSRASWDKVVSPDQVAIELGAKYTVDANTFVKAKIDNYGNLGLGFTQKLRPNVKLQLGGVFDTNK
ncbi:Mitochondrial porin, partial [Entophlyctis sp. JEL0112]